MQAKVWYERLVFNVGPGELIVILIVALVLLGPDKLPEMARSVGKGLRELRKATEDIKDQVETEMYALDDKKPRSPILKSPGGQRVAHSVSPAALAPMVATAVEPVSPAAEPAAPAAPAFAATTPEEPPKS
jgi:sec-independent protein translocase protein TatB